MRVSFARWTFLLAVGCRGASPTTANSLAALPEAPHEVTAGTAATASPVRPSFPLMTGRVAAGAYHTCALASHGEVYCWGHNDAGQLGDGREVPSRVPVRVQGVEQAMAIAAATRSTCALRRDASVWCWGEGHPPAPVPGLGRASALYGGGTGDHEVCAVVEGAVWCWGFAHKSPYRTELRPPRRLDGLDTVDELCLGLHHVCARSGPRIRCQDDYTTAELGRSDGEPEAAAALADPRRIACDDSHLCALRGDSRIGCVTAFAGFYGHGGLQWHARGLGTAMVPAIDDAVDLVGGGRLCAARANGELRCWGFYRPTDRDTPADQVDRPRPPITMSGLEHPLAVAAGFSHTCTLGRDGGVSCIGDNRYGAVSGGADSISLVPELVAGAEGVRGLIAGDGYTCGLRGEQAHCWGWLDLVPGVGPELASPTAIDPARNVRELGIAPGEYDASMLCLAMARDVTCFSRPFDQARRIDLVGEAAQQRLWDLGPLCRLTPAGLVECEGKVRLDDRSFRDGDPPRGIGRPSDVVEVASGPRMICGRRLRARVACVKVEGSTVMRAAEVELERDGRRGPLTDAVTLATQFPEVCAVRRTGEVVCWTADDRFELVAETQPGLTSVRLLRTGARHSCALRRDGSAVCWGANESGQLGDGTVVSRELPVRVPGLADLRELAVGESHTCARAGDDRVWCWGEHLANGRAARAVAASAIREAVKVSGLPAMLPAHE